VSLEPELRAGIFVLATDGIIETIMENLVENAISFSPSGGAVAVRLIRDRDWAHLSVVDQGPGVPVGKLTHIFDRYYSERQITETSDRPPTYFGIGLSIVRRNVEALGGAVEAENRRPEGLIIHLRLPIAVPPRNT
jgi:two-component system sensor histidine kinase ChvG